MRLLFFGLVASLSACEENSCTLVGCFDGLTLTIESGSGAPISGASGTLVVDGDTEKTIEFDCSVESGEGYICLENDIIFEVREGGSAEYTIQVDGRSDVGVITLDFEESRPNGADCEPICYNDEHTITLEDFPVDPE